MPLFYRLCADLVVIVHVAYAGWIVIGLLLFLLGGLLGWNWVRKRSYRFIHLAMIVIVVAESLAGIVCPLTVWEKNLRELAGDASYQGDFIAHWVHELLFFDGPPWVFTLVYTAFGLMVLLSFWLVPVRRAGQVESSICEQNEETT